MIKTFWALNLLALRKLFSLSKSTQPDSLSSKPKEMLDTAAATLMMWF